jgi:hypothetical protein
MYNTKLRRKCNPLFQFSVLLLLHYMFRPQSAIIRCITHVVATLHAIQNLKTPDFTIVLVASSIGPVFNESPCWPCGLYLKSLLIFTRHFDLEFSIFRILKIYNLNIKYKILKILIFFLNLKSQGSVLCVRVLQRLSLVSSTAHVLFTDPCDFKFQKIWKILIFLKFLNSEFYI